MLFGLPKKYIGELAAVRAPLSDRKLGETDLTAIFLFNVQSFVLLGPFLAASSAAINIEADAFSSPGRSGVAKGMFPAQLRVKLPPGGQCRRQLLSKLNQAVIAELGGATAVQRLRAIGVKDVQETFYLLRLSMDPALEQRCKTSEQNVSSPTGVRHDESDRDGSRKLLGGYGGLSRPDRNTLSSDQTLEMSDSATISEGGGGKPETGESSDWITDSSDDSE